MQTILPAIVLLAIAFMAGYGLRVIISKSRRRQSRRSAQGPVHRHGDKMARSGAERLAPGTLLEPPSEALHAELKALSERLTAVERALADRDGKAGSRRRPRGRGAAANDLTLFANPEGATDGGSTYTGSGASATERGIGT